MSPQSTGPMRRARLATLFLTLFLGCAPASHETARQFVQLRGVIDCLCGRAPQSRQRPRRTRSPRRGRETLVPGWRAISHVRLGNSPVLEIRRRFVVGRRPSKRRGSVLPPDLRALPFCPFTDHADRGPRRQPPRLTGFYIRFTLSCWRDGLHSRWLRHENPRRGR